jgi:hypothetical protein
MTEGSVFRIYPPGSIRLAPPERPLGTARISSVSTYESTAAVIEKTEIPVGSRAVEQQHRFGDARLRVYLTGPPGSPALSAVRQQLASEKYIELVEQPSRCQMQVRERNGRLETLTNGGFTMSTPLPVGSSDTPARLLEQLQEWAKWFTVLQVRDPGDGPAVQFELMSVRPDGDSPVSGLFMRPDSALKPEDKVQLVIKNNHEKSVYVTVLDMESTGRIQIAYPPDEGEAALLRAGNEIKHRRIMDVPPGRSFVTDTFKLIASSQQIDLRPLCRPEGIKSPDDVKMTEDLMNELLGQDSGAKGSRNELRPGEWATAQKTVLVRRR